MPSTTSRLVVSLSLASALIATLPAAANAAEVDMRDFILIDRGMSEAEILYRLGPSDHETVYTDRYQYPIRKRWAYLPAYGRRGWITEITFDRSGHVQQIERYRP